MIYLQSQDCSTLSEYRPETEDCVKVVVPSIASRSSSYTSENSTVLVYCKEYVESDWSVCVIDCVQLQSLHFLQDEKTNKHNKTGNKKIIFLISTLLKVEARIQKKFET